MKMLITIIYIAPDPNPFPNPDPNPYPNPDVWRNLSFAPFLLYYVTFFDANIIFIMSQTYVANLNFNGMGKNLVGHGRNDPR